MRWTQPLSAPAMVLVILVHRYGKSALDFADDELDAAKAVYKNNAVVRDLLEEFHISKARGNPSGIKISTVRQAAQKQWAPPAASSS